MNQKIQECPFRFKEREWVVASGHTNYILTHRDTPGTKELLEKDELLDNFKEIIGSESPFPRKPAPDAI
ncbi:hypothetical protein [uncultured Enterococcus sp.]|uniref:hypothetical protein n=1 Tax=uncultured Enterococcus sp. TaxID=167972 RepID=UPI0025979ED4|nr:hypothetical protein [uncultured Enterococcus sp.]